MITLQMTLGSGQSQLMANCPWTGHGQVCVAHFEFWKPQSYLSNNKCCTQVGHMNWPYDHDLQNGSHSQSYVNYFVIIWKHSLNLPVPGQWLWQFCLSISGSVVLESVISICYITLGGGFENWCYIGWVCSPKRHLHYIIFEQLPYSCTGLMKHCYCV